MRSIIEDKVSAYLSANITDTTVVKGVTDSLRSLPTIVVYSTNALPPKELGATPVGNYTVNLDIYVYSSADDDTLEQHRQRVSKVHGLMADVVALKALWNTGEGKLYAAWIESDEEGMQSRNFGNKVCYTFVACLPPAP